MSSLSARTPLSLPVLLALATSLALACDGDKGEGKKNAGSIAKALDMRAEIDANKQAADEKFEKEYAAKKQAEEARAKAALDAKIEAITVMPAKPVKGLKKACDDVADAHDEMMKRRWAEDAKELMLYFDRRRAERAEVREKCRLNTAEDSANCYAHALRQTEGELYEQTSELMRRCVKKFGGAGDLARG